MRTVLVWNCDHPLAAAVCRHLADCGHRLLLVSTRAQPERIAGKQEDSSALQLAELDYALSQSELHRCAVDPPELATWTEDQGVGLDAIVLLIDLTGKGPARTGRANISPCASAFETINYLITPLLEKLTRSKAGGKLLLISEASQLSLPAQVDLAHQIRNQLTRWRPESLPARVPSNAILLGSHTTCNDSSEASKTQEGTTLMEPAKPEPLEDGARIERPLACAIAALLSPLSEQLDGHVLHLREQSTARCLNE